MLSCSIWFSEQSFWKVGGLESRCVGRVYGADGLQHHPHRTHDLRSSNSTSNVPDDGRMCPKHFELRVHQ